MFDNQVMVTKKKSNVYKNEKITHRNNSSKKVNLRDVFKEVRFEKRKFP